MSRELGPLDDISMRVSATEPEDGFPTRRVAAFHKFELRHPAEHADLAWGSFLVHEPFTI